MEEKLELILVKLKLDLLSEVFQVKQFADKPAQNQLLWLTAEQLAEHWGMINPEGRPKIGRIINWTKRDEHPLPHGRMGDLIKFDRDEADQWAKDEAVRLLKIKNPNKKGL